VRTNREEAHGAGGGVLPLLIALDRLGVELVFHRPRFIGVRGQSVDQLAEALWDAIALHKPELLRRLKAEPPPGRRRQAKHEISHVSRGHSRRQGG
jgi:hypothetical protein